MEHDLILNNKIEPVSGIQIGDNPCQMIDVNVDPITHIARLDYSFVSLEFMRKPQSVFNNQFMKQTESINKSHNKKFGASRHLNNATKQLFGNQLLNMQLGEEEIATTTISYKFNIDPKAAPNTGEFSNLEVFLTPTIGVQASSITFKESDKLRWKIQRENEKEKPVAYENNAESKLKLIYRFFKWQGVDAKNARHIFQETTKGAAKMAHELMRDFYFDNEIQIITQLDRGQFKALRKSQLEQGVASTRNDYKKKVNYCSTNNALDLMMENGVTPDFFKTALFNADKGLAIFNTSAARNFLITGNKNPYGIGQCNRIGEIQDFQVQEGIRPVHLKPTGLYLRPLKAA